MSSVIVRGMDMPENCIECRFESEVGFCKAKSEYFCGYTHETERPDWCPLLPLPSEHGSLIDRVDLIDKAREVCYPIVHGVNSHEVGITFFGLQQLVSEQPVIIPAERSET